MGLFITFEGIEGSGKTTQIQLLSNHLEERGVDHVLTREPGGTPIGDRVRRLVLDPAHDDMTATCELLLYGAARAQHVEQVIRPALRQGRVVLCDRFMDATLAYQGYGRGIAIDLIRRLHGLVVPAQPPHRTVLFDIEARAGLERARARDRTGARGGTRFEREEVEFHERVRAGYLELSRQEPDRIVVVDARGGLREVHARLLQALQDLLDGIGAG
ncbi:MAG: dTMP kinase [Acidobacteriota bacterium]